MDFVSTAVGQHRHRRLQPSSNPARRRQFRRRGCHTPERHLTVIHPGSERGRRAAIGFHPFPTVTDADEPESRLGIAHRGQPRARMEAEAEPGGVCPVRTWHHRQIEASNPTDGPHLNRPGATSRRSLNGPVRRHIQSVAQGIGPGIQLIRAGTGRRAQIAAGRRPVKTPRLVKNQLSGVPNLVRPNSRIVSGSNSIDCNWKVSRWNSTHGARINWESTPTYPRDRGAAPIACEATG